MKEPRSGKFISLEGGEGAGKTQLLQQLLGSLAAPGREIIATREPGGTTVAEVIRKVFAEVPADEVLTMESELFLISAARSQHVAQLIRPALARGAWVLCDRFADSTRVYQGHLGGLSSTLIETLIAASTALLEPHLTLYLDCPVEVAEQRLQRRKTAAKVSHSLGEGGGVGRYDGAERALHQQLRQGFQALCGRFPQRVVLIDASQSPDLVLKQALTAIKERC